MGPAVQRSLDDIAAGVAAWLADTRGGHFEVVAAERPSEGFSSETVMFTVRSPDGADEAFVVRLAPDGDGAFEHYDLGVQVAAQRIAADHGIPVAAPTELVADARWLGAPFMVMPTVAGHVGGQVAARDRWITDAPVDAQRRFYEGFVDVVASIHRIDPAVARGRVPERDIGGELAYWQHYLDWCADGERVLPPLDDALAWCVEHRPLTDPPPSLLWGDVRIGNVVFDDTMAPVAVLDWEMTTVGAAEHDVAWWRTLEAVQDEFFGRRVPGFPSADDARAHYESRLGRRLQHLAWFEVLALVRSVAVMTRLAILGERAGQPGLFPIADNPLVGIIQRRIDAFG
jgi:aminoglycoside phosphotransferase (APT) family kinase protein